MYRNRWLLAVLALLLVATPAWVDQIVGEWAPPGGSLRLIDKNYDDDSSAAQAVDASVRRHHVDFVSPAGQPGAGMRFDADQLSDEEIRVTIGEKAAEIWMPCKPVS